MNSLIGGYWIGLRRYTGVVLNIAGQYARMQFISEIDQCVSKYKDKNFEVRFLSQIKLIHSVSLPFCLILHFFCNFKN